MIRRPPRSTRTDTLFPYTTLCRAREQRLLHALATGGAEADIRHPVFEAGIDAAHEFLADDTAHRTAHEAEFERRCDQRHAHQLTPHDDQRVLFFSICLRFLDAVDVLAAVLELQRIARGDVGTALLARFGVEKEIGRAHV